MAANRWISVAVLAGCTAGLSTRAVFGADGALPDDLTQLNSTIVSTTASQPQREEAARRLASRTAPQAHQMLAKVLGTGAPDSELAVARALGDDPHPDPQFIPILSQLLGTDRLHEAVSRALARYIDSDAARDRLVAFARDPRQSTRLRVPTIRALAPLVDKRVAATLVDLLTDSTQYPAIQNAAADALVDMTGLTDNGRDAQRWKQWYSANASRPDAEWKATVYATRSARLEETAQKYTRLLGELDKILIERYGSAQDKADVLLRYLNNPEPDVRAVGARIMSDNFLHSLGNPPKANDRLAELVGDSDVRVRLEAAKTLKSINYAPALDAMLVQLAQEQDVDVKVALVAAIAVTGDLKALPLFRKLLHDPSLRVATAAAEAFVPAGAQPSTVLSQVLYSSNKTLAREVAQELWALFEKRGQEPGASDLRAAILDAIVPLRDPALVIPLTRLLSPDQPDRVRTAALRALGELGDPNSEDAIKSWLGQENDPEIRKKALDALAQTGSFALDAEMLYSMFGPRSTEPDPAVQAKAYDVFKSLLPTGSKQLLSTWANTLAKEPKRQLDVLQALNAKLTKDADLENLAEAQQTMGDTYMKTGEPQEAALQFRNALSYWQSQHAQNATTEGLVRSLMIALLKSAQYDRAAQFAAKSIENSRDQQSTMGPLIRDEVDALITAADKDRTNSGPLKNAARLVDEAMKMKPALDDQYLEDLKDDQKKIKDRLAGGSAGN